MRPEPTLRSLVGDAVVWDNHSCMPLRAGETSLLTKLARVRAAGVDVVTLNVAFSDHTSDSALAMLATFRAWLSDRSAEYQLISSVRDICEGKRDGKLSVCFDIEGADALDGDLDNLGRFYDLGVRWMLFAYNGPSSAGGGCLLPDEGLTTFGRAVIAEMNAVGMVICASHCGDRTAREMIDLSARPVIFSHSNPSAVWNHPRNISDDLMRACAARGGVVGLNGFGPFLGPNDASTDTFIRHVEHALQIVGDDHVGIGLDYVFDREELDAYIASDPELFPPAIYPQGAAMIEPWRLPEIALRLHQRGHATSTLAKIFGENHLRIAHEVWT